MFAIKQIPSKLRELFSGRYIRNVGWLGGAELVHRVFRLGTTITLARVFSEEEYGLMALVYTTFEFANVFTLRHGTSAKIIQADDKHLETICNTSYWLNWLLCLAIFLFQCLVAFPIAYFYQNDRIALPLCISASVYLFMPLFLVSSAIIERENRLKVTAYCHASQSLISNFIIVILALLGFGIWAIVLALVVSTPIWIVVTWRNHPWRPPKKFTLSKGREIALFAKDLLGVEILNKLRLYIDYLIVGKFLGVEAMGMYFFAFNAGSGITTSVVTAFTSALLPHLCDFRDSFHKLKQQYYSSLKTISLIVIPLVLAQSALAPIYVPIIFGSKWISAIPVLILVCLSVIPRPFSLAAGMLLTTINKTQIALYFDILFTVVFTASIFVAVHWGTFWVAATVLATHILILPIFTVWTPRYVFSRDVAVA
jgi:PST family polysaccharide transporter